MMSVSAMVEPFDAQMSDFNEDADMGMGGPSTENWFAQHPSTHMDEDAQINIEDVSDTQEVEMMGEGYDEYQMEEDHGIHFANPDSEVIDAEVDDAIQTLPLPPVSSGAMMEDPPELEDAPQPAPEHLTAISEVPPVLQQPDSATTGSPFVTRASSIAPPSDIPQESILPIQQSDALPQALDSDSFTQQIDGSEHASSTEVFEHAAAPIEQSNANPLNDSASLKAPANLGEDLETVGGSHAVGVTEGERTLVSQTAAPVAATSDDASPAIDEGHEPATARLSIHEETTETLETGAEQAHTLPAEGVSSPPIFLSLNVTTNEGEQPEFVLFAPAQGSKRVEDPTKEEPLVLLQHHAHLFYEPISAVFEVFRQEEYFTHIEELSESEMILSASELQLSISEDNIYAREVSLHDLFAMHQGVGLPGHLRLTLESVVPRFIVRYNVLRDQITKLSLDGEAQAQLTSNNADSSEQRESQANQETVDEQDAAEHVEEAESRDEFGEEDADGDVDEEAVDADSGQANAQLGAEQADEGNEEVEAVAINESEGQQPFEEAEADDTEAFHDEERDGEDVQHDELEDGEYAHDFEDDDVGGELDNQEDGPEGADALETATDETKEPAPDYAGESTSIPETHALPDEDDFGSDEEAEHGDGGTDEAQQVTRVEEQDLHDASADVVVQAQVISNTASASSSLNTEDLAWKDHPEEVAGADPEVHDEGGDDVQRLETTYDEQGNATSENALPEAGFEDDDFGEENFDEFDFEDSTADTLEGASLLPWDEDFSVLTSLSDPNEEIPTTFDIVEDEFAVEKDTFEAVDAIGETGVDEPHASLDDTSPEKKDIDATAEINERPKESDVKRTAKRRSDDAELDGNGISSPESPGSKRSRVL